MEAQKNLLSDGTLAAIRWLGMPEGTPFPLAAKPRQAEPPAPVEAVAAVPVLDPAAWAEDFHRWALSNCVYRDRCFGGIGALRTDFRQWTLSHDSVPCRDETFEQLLRDAGFFFADGLVYGLVLKEDWDSVPFRARRTHAREKGMRNE